MQEVTLFPRKPGRCAELCSHMGFPRCHLLPPSPGVPQSLWALASPAGARLKGDSPAEPTLSLQCLLQHCCLPCNLAERREWDADLLVVRKTL